MSLSTLTATISQQLVDLGKTRVGEEYIFGALAPKDKSNYHGPWDCAEFVSWVIFQTSGKLYGCDNDGGNPATADAFTGFFNRDAHHLGNIISVSQASSTPGALLLRAAVPDLIGHVVICDGTGGTVEAHGHADGVIKGKVTNRRWDLGILIPGVSYNTLPSVPVDPPQTIVFHVTTPLMISPKVGEIQQALIDAGFDPKGVDDKYGKDTTKAVIEFQKQNGLLVDGEVGEKTAAALGVVL